MPWKEFLRNNWFSLAQSVGIIATLILAILTLVRQMRQTRAANSLLVTQHHREIWALSIQNTNLFRVFDLKTDLERDPITEQERTFVYLILLHMSATLKATKAKVIFPVDGMRSDIEDILAHPIPATVWLEVKPFHDAAFVRFVGSVVSEATLRENLESSQAQVVQDRPKTLASPHPVDTSQAPKSDTVCGVPRKTAVVRKPRKSGIQKGERKVGP